MVSPYSIMGMLATMVMEMINRDNEDKGRNIAKLFGHLTKIFVDATTEESAPLLDPVKRRIDQPRRVNHLLIRQTVPSLLLLHLPSSSLYVPEPQDTRTIWINFQGK